MESLAPVLVERMDLLLDELPADSIVLLCDPERVRARAIEVVRTGEEFLHAAWAGAASGGKAPVDLSAAALRPLARSRARADELGLALVVGVAARRRSIDDDAADAEPADDEMVVLDATAAESYRGDTQRGRR